MSKLKSRQSENFLADFCTYALLKALKIKGFTKFPLDLTWKFQNKWKATSPFLSKQAVYNFVHDVWCKAGYYAAMGCGYHQKLLNASISRPYTYVCAQQSYISQVL